MTLLTFAGKQRLLAVVVIIAAAKEAVRRSTIKSKKGLGLVKQTGFYSGDCCECPV